jgi:GDP-L-fucose synthase
LKKETTFFIAGSDTLIGSAIVRALGQHGFTYLVGSSDNGPRLNDAAEVETFFAMNAPQCVFVVAGKSGGIEADQKYPAEFMLDNLQIAANVISSAYLFGMRKLLYLASLCSYPNHTPQPMWAESLLIMPLEPTDEACTTAKLASIKLCYARWQQRSANFVAGIPTNELGTGGDFTTSNSHVVIALLCWMYKARVEEQKRVVIWGTGNVQREFIFADGLVDACIFIMGYYDIFIMGYYDGLQPSGIGSDDTTSIASLAQLVRETVGHEGELYFDTTKPDRMPLKSLAFTPLQALGWCLQTSLREALRKTYDWPLQSTAATVLEAGGVHG